ncbi:MAG: bifunctional DNA primase/polymerase [Gemmataceae bacterium]
MKKQLDTLGIALDALGKGIAPIPVIEGTKIPAVKWKRWQSSLPPAELVHDWFSGTSRNIAIICAGLVVFDCDDPAQAELVLAECGDTPHKLQTPRGGLHLGYRKRKRVQLLNQVRVKGMDIDIRTDGGLELIPFSRTEHGNYRWLGDGLRPASELPVAKIGWTRERRQRVAADIILDDHPDMLTRRARGYLACIEGAISGHGGHNRTFRVACVLVQKFGLTIEQALPLFRLWNQTCEPPWSEKELLHKLQDAFRLRSCFSEGGQQ